MNLNQQNNLDSYLSGRMTPDELQAFEAELGADPSLQQQVAFQSDVMKGIGEYRKAQLKARLDAVNVSPTLWSSILQSGASQFAAGVVAVSLIGGSLYLYFTSDSAENILETDLTEDVQTSPVVADTVTVLPEVVSESTVTQNTRSEIKESTQTEPKEETSKVTKAFNPKVAVPKAGDVNAEGDFTPDELPTPEASETSSKPNAPVEVEVISGRNTKIKYSYYGGKLYLYGDFSSEPYEILEINSSNERRIYLYHIKAYYEILPSYKAINVVEVTDQKLIQELLILRKTK